MRKKIILILLVGIIAISSFSIGYIAFILINTPNDDTPKFYIAIDDTYYNSGGMGEFVYGNKTYIRIGGAGRGGSGLFKFDLRDKPEQWSKLEVSFSAKYKYASQLITIRLLSVNWNESMTSKEIRDILRYPNPNWETPYFLNPRKTSTSFEGVYTFKFDIIYYLERADENIGDCLNNYDSITIELSPVIHNSFDIYSKEADVNKTWLPQLIWS